MRRRFLFVCLGLLLSVASTVGILQVRWRRQNLATTQQPEISRSRPSPSIEIQLSPSPEPTPSLNPTAPSPQYAVTPIPSETPPSDASHRQDTLPADAGYVGKLNLIIPVAGVKPDQLRDTFDEARSEGRVHDALDIPAPQGTPVLAAADGQIVKLFQSERGGTTIYQLSLDKKLVYYYAHLQRYADDVFVGKTVRQGDVIAYVGDTGNAGPGNYHLHFSIAILSNPNRYWEGTNINPYPLLHK